MAVAENSGKIRLLNFPAPKLDVRACAQMSPLVVYAPLVVGGCVVVVTTVATVTTVAVTVVVLLFVLAQWPSLHYVGHSPCVTGVCFSHDDSLLFSCGGEDGAVFKWAVINPEQEGQIGTSSKTLWSASQLWSMMMVTVVVATVITVGHVSF
jgi:hypothetical protein